MRILQVIDNLYAGGAERVMVNLCNWLKDSGVHVQIAIISGKGKDLIGFINPSIPVHIIERKHRTDLKAAKRLADLIKKFDVIHVHMRHNYRYVKITSLFFGCKIPILLHDHSSSPKKLLGMSGVFKPKYYVGVSDYSMTFAKEKLGVKNFLFKLENTINKQIISINEDRKDFVLVSNIKLGKNQLFAINLMKSFNTYKLYIYGEVHDFIYFKELKNQINKNKLHENVFFIRNCTQVQNHLIRYKIGLHTSTNETGPLAIIEYLAQKLPFVAYKTGEAASKLNQEFPEFFINNFDTDEWVERINFLLNNPPDPEKMEWVFQKYFSKESYVEKCLKIYQTILHC